MVVDDENNKKEGKKSNEVYIPKDLGYDCFKQITNLYKAQNKIDTTDKIILFKFWKQFSKK